MATLRALSEAVDVLDVGAEAWDGIPLATFYEKPWARNQLEHFVSKKDQKGACSTEYDGMNVDNDRMCTFASVNSSIFFGFNDGRS